MWNLLKDNLSTHKSDQSRAALSLVGWRKNVWQKKLDAILNTEEKKAIYVDINVDFSDYFRSLVTLRSVIPVDLATNLDELKILDEAECAIFIIDSELPAWEPVFERVIRSSRALQSCRAYCTLSREAHSGASDAYLTCSARLHAWMEASHHPPHVHVEHLPLAFTERLVEHVTGTAQPVDVLVSHRECFPVIDPQWKDAQDRIDVEQLPSAVKRDLKHCVHSLADMLRHVLDVKLSTDHVDCYVLGATADLIGNELMAVIAQNTHEDETHRDIGPVSLVLVDRTLDLVAPARFGADNVMDTIQALVDAHSADVIELLAPQARLAVPQLDLPRELTVTWPLSVPATPVEQQFLSTLIGKKNKEVLVEVKRILTSELLRDAPVNMSHSAPSVKASLEQLKSLVSQYPDVAFSHHHLLLLMRVALQALQTRDADRYHEALLLVLRLTLTTQRTGHKLSFAQFMDLINQTFINTTAPHDPTRTPDDIAVISARDFVLLCVLFASLSDQPLGWEECAVVKQFLRTTLLTFAQPASRPVGWLEPALRDQLARLVSGADSTEARQQAQLELEDAIDRVVERLSAITAIRAGLKDYRSLMKDTVTGGKSYTPLLRQVAEHVFNHREHELTDLKKLSFSLKGLLKKGFSKFGFHSKPRPTDNKNVIVFVLGGITWAEVKELRDVFQHSPHTQHAHLLIGATSLTSPDRLYDQLFVPRL